MATVNDLVKAMMQARELKKSKAADSKQEMAPLTERIEKLNNMALQYLNDAGVDSARTEFGTISKLQKDSFTVRDKVAFLEFIFETKNFHMLTNAVAKDSVKEYIKEEGKLPPGIEISSWYDVGLRAPTNKR